MRLILLFGALATVWGSMMEYRQMPVAAPVEDFVLVMEEPVAEQQPPAVRLLLQTGNAVEEIPLEEYLVGVVLSEMLPSFHAEALKAQAVAARTFAARMMQKSKHEGFALCSSASCCQAWHSRAELKKRLGSDFDACWEKAREAVNATEGMVLTYGGKLIEAVYFSCSGGSSEPARAVWGSEVPYLQAVESPGEEAASAYSAEIVFPFGEFQSRLLSASPGLTFPVIPQDWLGDTERSAGGGVETVEICGEVFTGTQLRSLFSLPSTLFELTVGNGEVRFSVRGHGHRVGMSQYGADAMAREGYLWQEIVLHYYTGVTVEELPRT